MSRATRRDDSAQFSMFGAAPVEKPSTQEPGAGKKSAGPVSVVIPTWNGRALLQRFLPSVVAALGRYPGGGEIVVVDDGSGDRTSDFLRESFSGVRVIKLGFNRGFAAAVNRGMIETLYERLILLNNDVGVAEDFIAPLVGHFQDPGVFAVCAKSLDWDGETFRDGGKVGQWRRGFWRVWRNYDLRPGAAAPQSALLSFYASGGFAAFDRDKWLALGGLDELFRPFNWEDTDICYRALKRGWSVLYEPASVVFHRPNTTIAGGAFRRGYVRYISRRNRLFFHWKNLTDPGMLAEHILFLLFSLPLSLLRLDFPALGAVFGALAHLGSIRARRREEKARTVLSDRTLRERYREFLVRSGIDLK